MTPDYNIARHLGAVSRFVGTRERDGRTAHVVAASRTYDTTPADLWDALTNPERIPRWFLPVSGDLRLGGRYSLEGNASGEITTCVPPRSLGMTWEYGGQVSWVTIQLHSHAEGGTRLELEHVAHVPDEMWGEFGPGAVGVGWESGLLGLGEHLATGAAVAAKDAVAWLASDQGKEFVRASSTGWCQAAIADGTDEATATAAAERTTAAYTAGG